MLVPARKPMAAPLFELNLLELSEALKSQVNYAGWTRIQRIATPPSHTPDEGSATHKSWG